MNKFQLTYIFFRILIWIFFLGASAWLSYLILFPFKIFDFDFNDPEAAANSAIDPRFSLGNLIMDASPNGDFSKIEIDVKLKKEPKNFTEKITIKKSYRAFFYPEGDPVELKTENLANAGEYLNGTLISFEDGAFIVSGENIFPIQDPFVFEAMGFKWNNIVVADPEKAAAYLRGKIFGLGAPHPNGTIFKTSDTDEYYLIDNGNKRKIINVESLDEDLKKNSITVSRQSLEKEIDCYPRESVIGNKNFSCAVSTESLQSFAGWNWQFELENGENIGMEKISLEFRRTINLQNIKKSLAEIKNKTVLKYAAK